MGSIMVEPSQTRKSIANAKSLIARRTPILCMTHEGHTLPINENGLMCILSPHNETGIAERPNTKIHLEGVTGMHL